MAEAFAGRAAASLNFRAAQFEKKFCELENGLKFSAPLAR